MKRNLMPATSLAAMKEIAFAILCVTLLMLVAAPAWAQGDQCSGALPVGTATGCGAIITVTGVDGNGNATFFTVAKPGTGNVNPYDGTDDTLVGIVNNSGQFLNSITISAPPIAGLDNLFAFETPAPGDGPCFFSTDGHNLCFVAGGTGYEGPNNTFSAISDDKTKGTVNFFTTHCDGDCTQTPGIGPGASTWFALEGTPNSLTSVTQTQQTPPGQTTTFNFGPFNFKSIVPATTVIPNGNALSITAVPIPPGTVINFDDGTSGICAVYDNTGGNCRAFDLKCSPGVDPNSCTQAAATYFAEFATSWDTATTVNAPGFGTGDFPCTLPFGTFTNRVDSFSQTRTDPTIHGGSGGKPPGGDCWIVATGVSYPSAKLSITKLAPPLVKTGTTLPYAIVVLNLGPGTATAVTVTDPVPAGTSYQNSAVCFTGSSGITCKSGANSPCAVGADPITGLPTVSCVLGNLLPFSFRTLAAIGIQLNFTATASKGQVISNTASVNDANNIPNPGVNSNLVKTTVCNAIVKGKCQ